MTEFNLEHRLEDIERDLDTLWDVGIKPWIFDFSVGIGRSVTEAEVAMKEAKHNHKKGQSFDPLESTRYGVQMLRKGYAETDLIRVYSNSRPRLFYVDIFDPGLKAQVEDSISYYLNDLTPDERKKAWHETRKLCFDLNTTAYTGWGHYFIEQLIKSKDTLGFDFLDDSLKSKILSSLEKRPEHYTGDNRYCTFWDGNNMKGCNDAHGMDDTTRHINVGAAAVVSSSRIMEPFSAARFGRKNGFGGDEFFQNDIACENIRDAYLAVKRLLYQSGIAQLRLYEPQLKEFYSRQ